MLASIMICQTLSDLVGDRIYPAPATKQADKSTPYITYQKISTLEAMQTMDEYLSAERIRVQVNIYHPEQLEAEKLANQLKKLLVNQKDCPCVFAGANSGFDEDTQLYAEMNDFLIWQTQC